MQPSPSAGLCFRRRAHRGDVGNWVSALRGSCQGASGDKSLQDVQACGAIHSQKSAPLPPTGNPGESSPAPCSKTELWNHSPKGAWTQMCWVHPCPGAPALELRPPQALRTFPACCPPHPRICPQPPLLGRKRQCSGLSSPTHTHKTRAHTQGHPCEHTHLDRCVMHQEL